MKTVSKSMAVLAVVGLVDSISFMAVTPSLIFYVLQVGGDKEIYGLIMSAFSFASFCCKPVYGIWVDKGGNKFRVPYISSFVLAIIGAFLYFLASGASSANAALAMIFLGRLMGGMGGANQALGYAYVASEIPHHQQTKINSFLALTRIVGMATGPAVNLLLTKVNATFTLGTYSFVVDPLNSVGLLLALGNILAALTIFFFLEEPSPKEKLSKLGESYESHQGGGVWKAIWRADIILPIYILLVINSAFQLIETGFPAVAADGLGWGPVETSTVLGSNSLVIMMCMALTVYLSGKIPDLAMVGIGSVSWFVGGTGMYLFWTRGASIWHYVLPIVIACAGFPFIAAANRSNFTKAVVAQPALEESQALMQSILSMASSVAGFVTPGIVAAYVVRSPEEVTASRDKRELSPVALYVPILVGFMIVGLWQLYHKEKRAQAEGNVLADGMAPHEGTSLLGGDKERRRSSAISIEQAFSRQSEVARRQSVQIMGIVAPDTKDEREAQLQMLQDMEDLKKLRGANYD